MYKLMKFGWRRMCVMVIGMLFISACSTSKTNLDRQDAPLTTDDGLDFAYLPKESIICEGLYPQHLQGISVDEQENIFWSFTTELVKTDKKGKVLHKVEVDYHHGDLDVVDGKVFVAVGFGKWNHIDGLADSWIYVYSADNLDELQRIRVPEVVYGAGGIVHKNDKFYVVGGLPDAVNENYVYEYDENFTFIKKHILQTSHTDLGIQTIDYHDGQWWIGTYGSPNLFILDDDFSVAEKHQIDISLGINSLSPNDFFVGSNEKKGTEGFEGKVTRYVKHQ